MDAMTTLLISLAVFLILIELLVAGIFLARRFLQSSGPFPIVINDEKTVEAAEPDKLLSHLYAAGIFIPSSCGGRGTCGLCRVQVKKPQSTCTALEEEHLSARERAEGYRLSCMVRVNGPMHIRVPEDILGAREVRAIVESNTPVTADIVHMALSIPEDFRFEAGQYVQIRIPAPESPRGFEFRAYSVASDPGVPGRLELAIRKIPGGLGSPWLHARKPGDELFLTGPYGEWRLSPDPYCELLLVSGGVGITPLRAILHAAARTPAKRVHFYHGARTREDLFWTDEWKALQERFPHWRFTLALSHEPDGSDWDGPRGFVHEVVDATWEPSGAVQVFLCGPPAMMEALQRVLDEKGVSPADIYADAF